MSRRRTSCDMPERDLIRWVRHRLRPGSRAVPIGPGDDMALVRTSSAGLLVAIDTIAEGVDFTLDAATPAQIGRKALAVNLSDVAAMGGIPSWFVASVNLTQGLGGAFARSLGGGLIAASRRYKCPLIGGDVTGWKDGVVVTVAIGASPAGKRALTRGGARPGDVVFVTGSLGGSILGKHLRFEPRLREGAWLARNFAPTAMIDVSDGLGVDAAHIADESGVGIAVDAATLPLSPAAGRVSAADGRSPLSHAISDGEDFELLFTIGKARAAKLRRAWPFSTPLTAIGTAHKGHGVTLVTESGRKHRKERIDSEGYQHC